MLCKCCAYRSHPPHPWAECNRNHHSRRELQQAPDMSIPAQKPVRHPASGPGGAVTPTNESLLAAARDGSGLATVYRALDELVDL